MGTKLPQSFARRPGGISYKCVRSTSLYQPALPHAGLRVRLAGFCAYCYCAFFYWSAKRSCKKYMGNRMGYAGLCGGITPGFYCRTRSWHSLLLDADRLFFRRFRHYTIVYIEKMDKKIEFDK